MLGFVAVSQYVYTYRSSPPTGYTGAPGNSNCSACHGNTVTSGSVWNNLTLTTTVPLASMQPNTNYTMSLSFSDISSTDYGFQLVALPGNAGSSTASIGSVAAGTGNTAVQTATSLSRTYVMHTSSGVSAPNSTRTWNFNFTTPSSALNGITFYVAVNSADGDFSAGPGDIIYLKTFSASVLPVKWLDLTAKYYNNQLQVNWSTASELNNQLFDVEVANDDNNFESIYEVKGNGTSNKTNYYTANISIDKSPLFVRIKQTDNDGKFSFSKTIKVEPKQTNDMPLTYYIHERMLKFNEDIDGIELYKINGEKVKSIHTTSSQFNLTDLAQGLYVLKAIGNQKETVSKIFIQ